MTDQPVDSSTREKPQRLTIGRISSPHGVRGEIRVYIYSHFPERIPELPYIYLEGEEQSRAISRARLKDNLAIMRIEGIDSREDADELRGKLVQIDLENAAPLDEGEFYHFEIIGLTAFDEEGNVLGVVKDIIETGANDVYVIKDEEGTETLIPALEDVVPEIDVEGRRMVVRPLRYSGDV